MVDDNQNGIKYAVIALNITEADSVIAILKNHAMIETAEWLNINKDKIYGNSADEWKPFMKQNIKDIIDERSDDFCSNTRAIEEVCENFGEIGLIDPIQIYFIDVFAMYLEQYRLLATRCSDRAKGNGKNFCFLMYYESPINVQKELEDKIKKTWPDIAKEYNDGYLHRIAVRVDDVNNFKNYLRSNVSKYIEYLNFNQKYPSSEIIKEINDVLGINNPSIDKVRL